MERIVGQPLIPDPAAPLDPGARDVAFVGGLAIPRTQPYVLQLVSTVPVTVSIDRRVLLRSDGRARWTTASTRLAKGYRPLAIEATIDSATPEIGLFWVATAAEGRRRIPATVFARSRAWVNTSSQGVRAALGVGVIATSLLFGCAVLSSVDAGVAAAGSGILLLGILLFSPAIGSDAVGYYSYLPSLVLDGDLDFRNEYAPHPPWSGGLPVLIPLAQPGGSPPNYWAIGPSFVWLPGFLVAHGIAGILGNRYQISADGFSAPYVWLTGATTACIGLAALGLCWGAARREFGRGAAAAAAVAAFVGTPFMAYTFLQPMSAHVLAAFGATAFLLLRARSRPLALASYAFAAAVYWQLALLALVPAVELAIHLFCRRSRQARGALLDGIAMAFVAVLAMTPQMLVWRAMTGSFVTVPQGAAFLKGRPLQNLVLMILSPHHGALWFSPVMLVAIPPLCGLARRNRNAAASLLVLAILALHNASLWDWTGGGGFGLRRLTPAILAFTLGLASLLRTTPRRRRGRTALLVGLPATYALATCLAFFAGGYKGWSPADWRGWPRNGVSRLVSGTMTYLAPDRLSRIVGGSVRTIVATSELGWVPFALSWSAVVAGATAMAWALRLGIVWGERLSEPSSDNARSD